MALYEAAAARTLTPVAAPTSGRFSRGRGVQALAPTSMLAGKHLPDPPRRDPACAPARYRLEQPMDRIHHHEHTIRNCRAGAQGPPLNNENAVNARKLMVLTAFGGSERSRVCRHLGTCAGVSAVSERPRRSAGCAFSHRDIGPNRPGAWDSLRALSCVARRAGRRLCSAGMPRRADDSPLGRSSTEGLAPARVSPCDVRDRRLARHPAVAPADEGVLEGRPPHREPDEADDRLGRSSARGLSAVSAPFQPKRSPFPRLRFDRYGPVNPGAPLALEGPRARPSGVVWRRSVMRSMSIRDSASVSSSRQDVARSPRVGAPRASARPPRESPSRSRRRRRPARPPGGAGSG